jgi:hypothetical protein
MRLRTVSSEHILALAVPQPDFPRTKETLRNFRLGLYRSQQNRTSTHLPQVPYLPEPESARHLCLDAMLPWVNLNRALAELTDCNPRRLPGSTACLYYRAGDCTADMKLQLCAPRTVEHIPFSDADSAQSSSVEPCDEVTTA